MLRRDCELCGYGARSEVQPVAASALLRVVRVLDAPDFPAYWRVVWNEHASEFSELTPAERAHCTDALVAVERVVLARLAPAKINLAALGNLVPHLHWHVVARFAWDSHFPQSIWGERQRAAPREELARVVRALPAVDAGIERALLALER
jgi:diadenosine tetraphosphate (Ap4A) HIT family hydrolase